MIYFVLIIHVAYTVSPNLKKYNIFASRNNDIDRTLFLFIIIHFIFYNNNNNISENGALYV